MPKVYVACGVAGFGLSFLTSLFSGARFALVLGRALAFGVAFAALAVLICFLLKRFVPGLFAGDSPEAAPSSSKLDITIGGEDDASPMEEGDLPDFMKSEGGENDASPMEEDDLPDFMKSEGGENDASPMKKEGLPDFMKSEGSENDASPMKKEGLPDFMKSEGSVASSPEAEPAEAKAPEGEPKGEEKPGFATGQGAAEGELEDLPDTADFGGAAESGKSGESAAPPASKAEVATGGIETPSAAPSRGRGFEDSSLFETGADAETMAKAIRTVLSKE